MSPTSVDDFKNCEVQRGMDTCGNGQNCMYVMNHMMDKPLSETVDKCKTMLQKFVDDLEKAVEPLVSAITGGDALLTSIQAWLKTSLDNAAQEVKDALTSIEVPDKEQITYVNAPDQEANGDKVGFSMGEHYSHCKDNPDFARLNFVLVDFYDESTSHFISLTFSFVF